ncbi:hypothetical protein [Streptomyces sp. CT34]|uniref:hypothetical protein n=1 Tax=Streptomyces sp. CT34 TaxID=1553907 RepID=UPI0005B978FC|nr:hypothetical protein [Streptomyces sp. CT34]
MHEPAHLDGQLGELSDTVRKLEDEVARLRTAQDRHSENLEHGLTGMQAAIGQLTGKVANFSANLSQTQAAVKAVRTTTEDTHRVLNSFVERYGRDQIVANAQAELSRLTTEWGARFAERRRIRALARGLAHALTEDAVARGVVDTSTIEACSQEQLLLEPTFWLAPAVVAVAAGYSRDTERTTRARGHALTLDQAKATLFFALTCSRQKRQSEAARWMDRYLTGLDPSDLGQEFSVVLDAVAGAELGIEALTYARQAMTRWDREGSARPFSLSPSDSALADLTRWQPWMLDQGADSSGQFDALRKLCGTQWAEAEEGWHTATAVKGTLDYLRAQYSDSPPTTNGSHGTDIALNHLISQLDPDESRMHEQMERLRAIIEHGGDTEAAAADFKAAKEPETIDFQALLERAVFEPGTVRLGYPARLLALHSAMPSLRPAVTAMKEQSESLFPEHLTLTVDGWSCQVPTAPTAPDSRQQAVNDLRKHLERRTIAVIGSVAPMWPRVLTCFTMAAACAVLAVFLHGAAGSLTKVLTVLLLTYAVWGVAHVPFRQHQLREDGTRRRAESTAELKKALGQHTRLFQQWRAGLTAATHWNDWSPAAGDQLNSQPEE